MREGWLNYPNTCFIANKENNDFETLYYFTLLRLMQAMDTTNL